MIRESPQYAKWVEEYSKERGEKYGRMIAESFVQTREWRSTEELALTYYRGSIAQVIRDKKRDLNALFPEVVGIGLRMDDDGYISVCSCPHKALNAVHINTLQKHPDQSWSEYWRAVRVTLRQVHYQQLKGIFRTSPLRDSIFDDLAHPYGGLTPVWLEGTFPEEARVSYPNVFLRDEMVCQFCKRTSVISDVPDEVCVQMTWKELLFDPNVVASLGLNPAVMEFIQAQTGTKLSYSMGPKLVDAFETAYDIPPSGTAVVCRIPRKEYTSERYHVPVQMRDLPIMVGGEFHYRLRNMVWNELERLMGTRLLLPPLAFDPSVNLDEAGTATCFICAETHQIGAPVWVDLRDCCGQACCINCLRNFTKIPEGRGHIKLFPTCPFCGVTIATKYLDPETADTLAFLRCHVRNEGDSCYTEEQVTEMQRTHRFSRCHECKYGISTLIACARDVDDVPDTCRVCIACLPNELNVKCCDPRHGGCGALIMRRDGCANVTCLCGKHICWNCGELLIKSHDPNHLTFGYFSSKCVRNPTGQKRVGEVARLTGR